MILYTFSLAFDFRANASPKVYKTRGRQAWAGNGKHFEISDGEVDPRAKGFAWSWRRRIGSIIGGTQSQVDVHRRQS